MGYSEVTFQKETVFLVTGGAGFIGSNLCEVLVGRGHRVRCLDNLSTGHKRNVLHPTSVPNFEFVEGDIRNLDVCTTACTGVDYVLHQAAWGSVPRSIEYPLLYEEINIKGTLNMLQASRTAGVKRFVYASSSSVYGDDLCLPKVEGREGRPLSPYALTKKANEDFARLYTELYGLETIGLRYFNVFGRRQDPSGPYAAVIPKFIQALLIGAAPVVHGDGTQSRDFTYIENVIEANLRACVASSVAAGRSFNVATGSQYSLLDLLVELSSALEVTSVPVYEPRRKGDVISSRADIGLARDLLMYDPDWGFREGLRETISWLKRANES